MAEASGEPQEKNMEGFHLVWAILQQNRQAGGPEVGGLRTKGNEGKDGWSTPDGLLTCHDRLFVPEGTYRTWLKLDDVTCKPYLGTLLNQKKSPFYTPP